MGTVNETDYERYDPYEQKVPWWIALVAPAAAIGLAGLFLILVACTSTLAAHDKPAVYAFYPALGA